jgi:hypothetical protein
VEGFIVWPPSTISVAHEALEQQRFPAPATTATTAHPRRVGHDLEQPLLALHSLLVHVRDLDPAITPFVVPIARAGRARPCARAP